MKRIAGPGPTPVALSGNRFVSAEGRALAIRERDGRLVRTLEAEHDPKCMALSPDMSKLAIGTWEHVAVLDLATGEATWKSEEQNGWCYAIAWAGSRIAHGSEGKVVVLDAATGTRLHARRHEDLAFESVAFSGDTLVAKQHDHVFTWSLDFETMTRAKADVGDLCAVDGQVLVLARGRVVLVDPVTGEERESLELSRSKATLSRPCVTSGLVAFLLGASVVVCGLSPLRHLETIALGDAFEPPEGLGFGGVSFLEDGSLVAVGKTETLLVSG